MNPQIGVDTHKDSHVGVALDELGRQLDTITIGAELQGYKDFAQWAKSLGESPRIGIEGAASYGAGLCQYLQAQNIEVFEVERPKRKQRKRGKSDYEDALLAARAVVSGEGLATVRSKGEFELLRLLLLAHDSCANQRSTLINQLKSVLISAPVELREKIAEIQGNPDIRRVTRMRVTKDMDEVSQLTLEVMKSFARRALELGEQKKTYDRRLGLVIHRICPKLLDEPGVGHIVAAKLLVSSPRRVESEQAFARMNGTAPIPASSGKTDRFRLNRGGDRQLNYALHMAAHTRSLHHRESRLFIEKKSREGKSHKEAMRALKRHLSRRLYRIMVA